MAINRAPWNALVDDSGQNLDGSMWNKAAIKTVVLDPVDAALALQPIAKGTGVNSATALVNVVTTVIPALLLTDTLKVFLSVYQTGVGGTLSVSAAGDLIFLRLDDIGGGSLPTGAVGQWEITIRTIPNQDQFRQTAVVGGVGGAGGVLGLRATTVFAAAKWTVGQWTLSIDAGGQAAGAQLNWSWTVYRLTA